MVFAIWCAMLCVWCEVVSWIKWYNSVVQIKPAAIRISNKYSQLPSGHAVSYRASSCPANRTSWRSWKSWLAVQPANSFLSPHTIKTGRLFLLSISSPLSFWLWRKDSFPWGRVFFEMGGTLFLSLQFCRLTHVASINCRKFSSKLKITNGTLQLILTSSSQESCIM